jgi:hypothetical protein
VAVGGRRWFGTNLAVAGFWVGETPKTTKEGGGG